MSQLLQYLGGFPASGGQGSPTMNDYGFNWYGGQPTTPEGGYYNQMAQAMAGPSYAPPGSNFYSAGGSSPSAGAKGALPTQTPSYISKGAQPQTPRAVGNAPHLAAMRNAGLEP